VKTLRPRAYRVVMRRHIGGKPEDRAWIVYAYAATEAQQQLERHLQLESYAVQTIPMLERWYWLNTFVAALPGPRTE
jgi:hypothetical protein